MLKNKKLSSYSIFVVLVLAVFLVSCNAKSSVDSMKYYSIKNLLNSQISLIKDRKISKSFELNGKKEKEVMLSPDLEKEFTLFFESDINKASYVQSYDSIVAPNSIKYILKANEDLPTKSIELITKEGGEKVLKIINRNQNYLYRFDSDLELVLVNDVISEYSITVIQKMFWGNAETVKVKGRVL